MTMIDITMIEDMAEAMMITIRTIAVTITTIITMTIEADRYVQYWAKRDAQENLNAGRLVDQILVRCGGIYLTCFSPILSLLNAWHGL